MSGLTMKRAGPAMLCAALVVFSLTGVLNLLPVHAPVVGDFTFTNKYVLQGAVTSNLGLPDGSVTRPLFNVANTVAGAARTITPSVLSVNSSASNLPTVSFNPPTFPIGGLYPDSFNATAQFTVDSASPHGAYNYTLAASDGTNTHYISYIVKVYDIGLTIDAQSTGPTDITPTLAFSPVRTFSVGVMVANATNTGGTNPKCTLAFPCYLAPDGFQIALNYDPTVLLPQGDPNPAATPGNSAGLYVDGAAGSVVYGGQTTIGEGSASWASILAAGNAFTASPISPPPNEIIRAYTLTGVPAAYLASATGRFLLGSITFELLQKPSSPTFVDINPNDMLISSSAGGPACSCFNSTIAGQGGRATETINNAPPTAKFTVTPLAAGDASCKTVYSLDSTSGCSGYSFRFDASSSTGSSALTYTWDFGDGSRDSAAEQTATCPAPDSDLTCSQGVTVVHDFGAVATLGGAPVPPSAYTVTLRVADASGATGSARDLSGNPISNAQPSHVSHTATANLAAQISFTFSPSSPGINQAVTFTSTSTDDSDGISTYKWNFGDGSAPVTNNAPTNTASHSYSLGGVYTVTLRVNDTLGATNTTTRTVSVVDLPPTVSLTSPNPTEGQVFTLTISEADPDGTIASNTVNWGDGTTPTSITGPTTSQTHTYATAGSYTINVTVTDNGGKTTSKTLALTVAVHQPPTLTITPSTAPTAGQSFTLTLAASATYGSVSNVTIDWGDGTTTTYPGNPASETHTYTNSGTYTITATATDTGGKTVQQTSTITVQAPSSPLLYIIIAIVAAAAAIAILLLVRKRRSQTTPTTTTTPPKK